MRRAIGKRKKNPTINRRGAAGRKFFIKEVRKARPLVGAPSSMTLRVIFLLYKLAHEAMICSRAVSTSAIVAGPTTFAVAGTLKSSNEGTRSFFFVIAADMIGSAPDCWK
jgi:hypothetical protein